MISASYHPAIPSPLPGHWKASEGAPGKSQSDSFQESHVSYTLWLPPYPLWHNSGRSGCAPVRQSEEKYTTSNGFVSFLSESPEGQYHKTSPGQIQIVLIRLSLHAPSFFWN